MYSLRLNWRVFCSGFYFKIDAKICQIPILKHRAIKSSCWHYTVWWGMMREGTAPPLDWELISWARNSQPIYFEPKHIPLPLPRDITWTDHDQIIVTLNILNKTNWIEHILYSNSPTTIFCNNSFYKILTKVILTWILVWINLLLELSANLLFYIAWKLLKYYKIQKDNDVRFQIINKIF